MRLHFQLQSSQLYPPIIAQNNYNISSGNDLPFRQYVDTNMFETREHLFLFFHHSRIFPLKIIILSLAIKYVMFRLNRAKVKISRTEVRKWMSIVILHQKTHKMLIMMVEFSSSLKLSSTLFPLVPTLVKLLGYFDLSSPQQNYVSYKYPDVDKMYDIYPIYDSIVYLCTMHPTRVIWARWGELLYTSISRRYCCIPAFPISLEG